MSALGVGAGAGSGVPVTGVSALEVQGIVAERNHLRQQLRDAEAEIRKVFFSVCARVCFCFFFVCFFVHIKKEPATNKLCFVIVIVIVYAS